MSGDSIQSPPDNNNNNSNNTVGQGQQTHLQFHDGNPCNNWNLSKLNLVDTSHQHAGHVGAKGFNKGESHFELTIVANAFEGLNLVKRHQLVYNMLGKEMPHIHALNIKANTPSEVNM